MGVTGLWDLLSPVGHRVSNEHVRNKVLAVDVSIWLTQFIKAMREADGATVRNAHLLGVLRRCVKLLFLAVKPVLIFDGDTPALKKRTLALRSAAREKHAAKLRRLAEKLLLVRLKQSALASVLPSHVARAAVKATSTFQKKQVPLLSNSLKNNPDPRNPETPSKNRFHDSTDIDSDEITPQLPAFNNSENKNDASDAKSAPSENSWDSDEERVLGLPEDLDSIDDDVLLSLPPKTQSEVLKQIKLQNRARHREHMLQHRNNPVSFSETQIAAFIRNTTLNRRLANVRNAINEHTGASQRIASDNARQFVFEEKSEKDARGSVFEDFDTDDEDEFGGDASKGNGTISKPVDILAKIRMENEAQRAWQAHLTERETEIQNQENEDRSGVGWASKVLSGGGRLLLSNHQLRSSLHGKDGDDMTGKSFQLDDDSAVFSNAGDGAVAVGNDVAGDDDSDDVEWEDGDANDKIKNISLSLAEQQNSFMLDSRDSGKESSNPVQSEKVSGNSQQLCAVGSSTEKSKPTTDSFATVGELLRASRSELIDVDSYDGTPPARPITQPQSSRGRVEMIDIDVTDDDEPRLSEFEIQTKEVNTGTSDKHETRMSMKSDNDKPSNSLNIRERPESKVCDEDEDSINADGLITNDVIDDPQRSFAAGSSTIKSVLGTDSYATVEELLKASNSKLVDVDSHNDNPSERANPQPQSSGEQVLMSVDDNNKKGLNSSDRSLGKLNEVVSDTGINSPESPSTAVVSGMDTGNKEHVAEVGEDEGRRIGDLEEDKELQLAIARSLETDPADATGRAQRAFSEAVEHGNDAEIGVDMNVKRDEPVTHAQISTEGSQQVGSGFDANDEDEITPVAPKGRQLSEKVTKTAREVVETDRKKDVIGNDDTSPDMCLGQGASVADIERLQKELQAEERELRQQGATHQAGLETVSDEMYAETRDLLKLLGIPYLQAPMEAEAQCAFLNMKKVVDGIITEDSDCFLFGGISVYRQLFAQGKFAEVYEATDISQKLGLGREELIRLAYLLGSDYTTGVRGVGVVNSMEILEAFPGENGLQEFKDWTEKVTVLDDEPEEEDMKGATLKAVRTRFCWKHRNMKRNWEIREGFPNAAVFEAYIRPEVDESTERFKWGHIDFNGLGRFCWDKFGWPPEKFENYIGPLRKELKERSGPQQRRIDEFFKPHRFAKIRSERLQQAVQGIVGDEAKELMADRLPKIKGRKRRAVAHVAQEVTEEEEMQMVQALEDVERSVELSLSTEKELVGSDEDAVQTRTRKRARRRTRS